MKAKQECLKDAFTEYQIALPIRESLVSNYPQNDVYQSNLSTSYYHIGDLYKNDNKLEEARQQYEKAFEIRDRLAHRDPNNADWQSALASLYFAIADVLATQLSALNENEAASEIRKQLTRNFPDSRDRQRELAGAYERVGDAFKAHEDLRSALYTYQRGSAVIETFMRRDPNSGLERARDNLREKTRSLSQSTQ